MPGKPKLVRDVRPGDLVPTVRRVAEVRMSETSTTLVFEDGSSETFELDGNPAIEVEP